MSSEGSLTDLQMATFWMCPYMAEKDGREGESSLMSLLIQVLISYGSFPGSAAVNLPADTGDAVSIPGLGRSPGIGNGNHSSILTRKIPWTEYPSWSPVHGITNSRTQLSTHTQSHYEDPHLHDSSKPNLDEALSLNTTTLGGQGFSV